MNDQILSELLYRICGTARAHDFELFRFLAYVDGLSDAGVLSSHQKSWLLDQMCNWPKGYDMKAFRAEFSAVSSSPAVEASPVAHVGESETSERLVGSELPVGASGVYLEVQSDSPARLPVLGLLGHCATSGQPCASVYRLPPAWVARTGEWPLACGARVQVSKARAGQAAAKILGCSGKPRQTCAVCPDAPGFRSGVTA